MLAYFGHFHCASDWIDGILSQICPELGLRYLALDDPRAPADRGPLTDGRRQVIQRDRVGDYARSQHARFTSCLTADMQQARSLAPRRAVHLIRDPRDLIVSSYFAHRSAPDRNGGPSLHTRHGERLQRVSKHEGLLLEMEHASCLMNDLATWDYTQTHVLEMKVEALTSNPYGSFVNIFRFFDLLTTRRRSQRQRSWVSRWLRRGRNRLSTWHPSLSKLRRRRKIPAEQLISRIHDLEEEGPARSGAAPERIDWSAHFTAEHVAAFKENFGDLVVQLGYEETNDWGKNAPATREAVRSAG